MPTLDDINIAPVQRGDQSHSVVIPRAGGSAGGRGCISASGGPTGGSDAGPAPSKGKQACVILNDDKISSDEDEPLQRWLRRLSNAGVDGYAPAMPDGSAVAAMMVADKEALVKRATE
jgi:hypothetical protein